MFTLDEQASALPLQVVVVFFHLRLITDISARYAVVSPLSRSAASIRTLFRRALFSSTYKKVAQRFPHFDLSKFFTIFAVIILPPNSRRYN